MFKVRTSLPGEMCVCEGRVCVCVWGGGGGGGAQILGISKFCVLEHLDHYP